MGVIVVRWMVVFRSVGKLSFIIGDGLVDSGLGEQDVGLVDGEQGLTEHGLAANYLPHDPYTVPQEPFHPLTLTPSHTLSLSLHSSSNIPLKYN